jgi:hypothetical protein
MTISAKEYEYITTHWHKLNKRLYDLYNETGNESFRNIHAEMHTWQGLQLEGMCGALNSYGHHIDYQPFNCAKEVIS